MDDSYIKNLLEQTLDSYKIKKGLKDKSEDFVMYLFRLYRFSMKLEQILRVPLILVLQNNIG